jgi:hypothetical protein
VGRNSLVASSALILALIVSGCKSGDAGPSKDQLAEQAHHGIDVTKMTEQEIKALPKPAQDAVRAQIAQAEKPKG